MASEFDPKKSARNLTFKEQVDLPFEAAREFKFETAVASKVTRNDPKTGKPYTDGRYQAIGSRTVFHVYVPKPHPVGFRTISLRPASQKERELWRAAQPKKPRR